MTKINIQKLPAMERRMLNILRSYSIPVDHVKGQQKAALNRLVAKGIAVRNSQDYKLSMATNWNLISH